MLFIMHIQTTWRVLNTLVPPAAVFQEKHLPEKQKFPLRKHLPENPFGVRTINAN